MKIFNIPIINYYTLRFLIIVIISLILLLIHQYLKKKKRLINNRAFLIMLLIIILVICYSPIDRFFVKFSTPTEVFEYYYPSEKIIKKYEYNDYCYIVTLGDKQSHDLISIVKKGNYWKFDNLTQKGSGTHKDYDRYRVYINEINELEITGITINYPSYYAKNIIIKDSIDSSFDIVTYDINEEWSNYSHTTIINGQLPQDYTLIIDGKEYKIFEE